MITVADLDLAKDRGEQQVFLLCDECFAQNSASPGDYWQLPRSHVFKCCGQPMRLVRKVVSFIDVELDSLRDIALKKLSRRSA